MFINLTDQYGRACFVDSSKIITATTLPSGKTRVVLNEEIVVVTQSPSEILGLIRTEEKKDAR